jgi:hypothetical protein
MRESNEAKTKNHETIQQRQIRAPAVPKLSSVVCTRERMFQLKLFPTPETRRKRRNAAKAEKGKEKGTELNAKRENIG